jgi:hypothetical protein
MGNFAYYGIPHSNFVILKRAPLLPNDMFARSSLSV